MKKIFGSIVDNRMILNKYGEIADKTWKEISGHFPDIGLDVYIVMPNHIHGIIYISTAVGAGHARPELYIPPVNHPNRLFAIMGSYKSAVTKRINQFNEISFHWQRSYYDHVIRTDQSLRKIREYITNNPATWNNDQENIARRPGRACPAPTA